MVRPRGIRTSCDDGRVIRDRDLLARAVAARLATDEELELYARRLEPDPTDGMSDDELADYTVRSCASGAPADLPPRTVAVAGRRIPPPPRGPRGRSPRGKGRGPTETTLSAPQTGATPSSGP